MVHWGTVIAAICLGFLIYFLVRGIRMALSNRTLPEPKEGDYTIQVIGKTPRGDYLAVMSPCGKPNDKEPADKS